MCMFVLHSQHDDKKWSKLLFNDRKSCLLFDSMCVKQILVISLTEKWKKQCFNLINIKTRNSLEAKTIVYKRQNL